MAEAKQDGKERHAFSFESITQTHQPKISSIQLLVDASSTGTC